MNRNCDFATRKTLLQSSNWFLEAEAAAAVAFNCHMVPNGHKTEVKGRNGAVSFSNALNFETNLIERSVTITVH